MLTIMYVMYGLIIEIYQQLYFSKQ